MNTGISRKCSARFAEDEAHCRCTIARNPNEARSLHRLYKLGRIWKPYHRIYVRMEYWKQLSPPNQMRHVVRAAHQLHPTWNFGRESALCMYDLEQSYGLYAQHKLVIVSQQPAQKSDHARLCRLSMGGRTLVSTTEGIAITDASRTLFDCGMEFDFTDALSIFDSAARHGWNMDAVSRLCDAANHSTSKIQRLLEHADPLSENGGESKARAVIIELGFMPPKLQQTFHNPHNPEAPLRTDYLWYGPGGAVIVAEFDGMEKYGKTYSQINDHVARQTERDAILMRQGVTRIVHFTYNDVVNPLQLRFKLEQAGVPYRRGR